MLQALDNNLGSGNVSEHVFRVENGDNEHAVTRRLPLILPVFSGDGDIHEWIEHFKSVAVLNGWDDKSKLQWLRVRAAGKARVTLTRLGEGSYKSAKKGLCDRFDPPGRRDVYRAELQCRIKREDEIWGDIGRYH